MQLLQAHAQRCAAIVLLLTAGVWGSQALAALNSPTRLAALARLPDWSGVWQVEGSTATLDGRTEDSAMDDAPYNREWQTSYEQTRAKLASLRDSYDRFCYAGMPRVMASPQLFMLVVTPEETLLQGARHDIRHIWTDGRTHPPADELWPLFWGESVGKWQGQTLVIETVSIKGGLWLDPTGATLSDAAHITERISPIDRDHLRNQITIVDPKALMKPWIFTRTYRRTAQSDLPEEDCRWVVGSSSKTTK